MARFQGANAIVVETFGDVDVVFPDIGALRRGPAGDSFVAASILQSVGTDAVVTRVDLAPSGGAVAPARRAIGGARPVTLEVPLAENENAAALVESEGVLHWRFPDEEPAAAPLRRGPGAGRVVKLRIGQTGPAPGAAETHRGGFAETVGGALFDRARVYVLKWAARKAVETLRDFMERNLVEGLIDMRREGADWTASTPPPAQMWPQGRPPRVLLMIHGTFSSTLGSFGPLLATDYGRAFLAAAGRRYDAIYGFDHSTLSEDPAQNAQKIAAALRGLGAPAGTTIDMAAYSRGGLVARTLAEGALSAAAPDLTIDRVVFVGCTNGGTALANPENWRVLIDLTTNLAAAAGSAVSWLGQPIAGKVLSESVKTVGGLIQGIIDSGVDPHTVAGIAAMRPNSETIARLDAAAETAPPRPAYFALGSHFETSLFKPQDSPPRGFSQRLVLTLANLVSDGVMRSAGDLVVDNAAMHSFGGRAGRLKTTELWGQNIVTYHLNYFATAEIVEALTGFLLSDPAQASPVLTRSLSIVDAGRPAAETLGRRAELEATSATALVYGADTGFRRYVRPPGWVLEKAAAASDPGAPLSLALGLRETEAAAEGERVPDEIPATGFVLMENGAPVGAVSPLGFVQPAPLAAPSVVRGPPVEEVVRPSTFEGQISGILPPPPRRRGVAPDGGQFVSGETATPPRAPVNCAFMSEMPPSASVGAETEVKVTVSRGALAPDPAKISALAAALVEADAKLTIELTAANNCEIASVAKVPAEIPAEGQPDIYLFKVRGLAAGQGELWIDVRDGERRIARMVLQPTFFVEGRLAAAAASAFGKSSLTLRIYEIPLENNFVLSFELQSQDLGILIQRNAGPFGISRDTYVNERIYKKLEQSNIAGDWDVAQLDNALTSALKPFYETLVPREIRAKLWECRDDIGNITVISSEPFIPWELMKLIEPEKLPEFGAPYLAELGLLRWIANAGLAPATLQLRPTGARYVIPNYLDPTLSLGELAQERAMVERTLLATSAPSDSVALAPFLREGDFDILHFAGHGDASNTGVYNASLYLQDRAAPQGGYYRDTFGVDEVAAFADFSRRAPARPLVFVNACRTGQGGRSLSGVGGMAQAFVRAGAGAVVAASWSIADKPAFSFAEAFYKELLAGHPLETAVREARKTARAARDPTWLAYTVYGHPYAQLRLSESA